VSKELVYSFGYFRLVPGRGALLAGDQPIKLGARAFDLLVTLVAASGRMVTKHELIVAVWPQLVVEENNLNVQIVALRKVLGYAAIATIPGRGYRFVLPVSVEGGLVVPALLPPEPPDIPQDASAATARTNVSGLPPLLYGRDDDVNAVIAAMAEHRLVTVAGAGGIGKTRVGEAAAHRLLAGRGHDVWWVDLAPVTDVAAVAATVARALGLDPGGTRPQPHLIASALRGGRSVLILDNCEHLVDAVSAFLASLSVLDADVRFLVTSQEALKAPDEYVYRLGTLAVPASQPGKLPTPQEAERNGAVGLFVARARSRAPSFRLTVGNVEAVVEICRCLDGIPLAIELAAARLSLLGVDGVRARLKERFNVLTGGTRAVLRRHQTLRAALEWSHSLLGEPQQRVFRRLGVFTGGFTLESAQRVAEDEEVDIWDVLELLGALIDKSLVLAEGDSVPRYRMLETTRLFALEQLGDAGETEATLRRHAVAMAALFADYERQRLGRGATAAEDALLRAEGDNIRAAYDWLATTGPADDLLAVELGSAAMCALACAGGVSEAFDRTLVFGPRIGAGTPPEAAARFWLELATWGAIVGRVEAYEAAQQAIEYYRKLKDDAGLYRALTSRIAIGARRGESARLGSLVEEARRIERPDWPRHRLTNFRWACYRWLQAEGRPDEAMACALERAAINAAAGLLTQEQVTLGDTVADCELSAGRADAAEARCRSALRALRGDTWGCAHVLETLAYVCTAQGKDGEAIEHGHAATLASRDIGMHFRMLEAMALNAARQGRLRDAAWAAGHVDRLYAERGEVRWPFARARRAELDALLIAGLEAAEYDRLRARGAADDIEVAFERAFGPDTKFRSQSHLARRETSH
jgi:predicted ATPase/DNA-binding winged helix-turn-helix (wHTH) protein